MHCAWGAAQLAGDDLPDLLVGQMPCCLSDARKKGKIKARPPARPHLLCVKSSVATSEVPAATVHRQSMLQAYMRACVRACVYLKSEVDRTSAWGGEEALQACPKTKPACSHDPRQTPTLWL